MKQRADLYRREAGELLRNISMYPRLSEAQLCRFFPGKEETIRTLLARMVHTGRVVLSAEGRCFANAEQFDQYDPNIPRAVWVMLDFLPQVEYNEFCKDGKLYVLSRYQYFIVREVTMSRTSKKNQYPDMICGIPRANLEQFARFICPYVEEYYADEKNMAEYQKAKKSGKLSQSFHRNVLPKEYQNRIPDFVVIKFR